VTPLLKILAVVSLLLLLGPALSWWLARRRERQHLARRLAGPAVHAQLERLVLRRHVKPAHWHGGGRMAR
jgi:hypothetical protein